MDEEYCTAAFTASGTRISEVVIISVHYLTMASASKLSNHY